MTHYIRICGARVVLMVLVAFLVSGCKLASTLSSSCAVSVTADGGAATQQKISAGNWVAQSFSFQSAVTVGVLGLRLQNLTTQVGTNLTGNVLVSIEQDSVQQTFTGVAPTPHSPSAANPVATGTLSAASVTSNQAQFYEISLASSASLSANTIYWVVVSTSDPLVTTDYVAWNGAPMVTLTNQLVLTSTNQGATWTSDPTQSMDLLLGCPTQ